VGLEEEFRVKQGFGNTVGKKMQGDNREKRGKQRGQGKAKTRPEKVAFPHRGRCPTGREIRGQNFFEKAPKMNT